MGVVKYIVIYCALVFAAGIIRYSHDPKVTGVSEYRP